MEFSSQVPYWKEIMNIVNDYDLYDKARNMLYESLAKYDIKKPIYIYIDNEIGDAIYNSKRNKNQFELAIILSKEAVDFAKDNLIEIFNRFDMIVAEDPTIKEYSYWAK